MRRSAATVLLLLLLVLVAPVVLADTGLSLDSRGLSATDYTPQGILAFEQPLPNGNGWTVEFWATYQPLVVASHVLWQQRALPSLCPNRTFNTFEYSIRVLATGFVRATVVWCNGSLQLDSQQALQGGVGVWTHIAVVFRRGQGIFLFFGGSLENATPLILPSTDVNIVSFVWSPAEPFTNTGTLRLFDDTGLLDEMRFWQRAQSDGAVRSNYCKRLRPSNVLTALYNFDSNLGPSNTRVYLNTTFDISPLGHNHLIHSPPLTLMNLPMLEPPFCPNSGSSLSSSDRSLILGLCLGFLALAIVVCTIIVIAVHATSRAAANRTPKGTSGPLAGAQGRVVFLLARATPAHVKRH